MKKYFFVLVFLSGFISTVSSDTIYLHDGSIVEGKIIEKDNYSLKVESTEGLQQIFTGQIERIIEDKNLGEFSADSGDFPDISQSKVDLIVKLLKASGMSAQVQQSAEEAIKKAPAERREEFKHLFEFNSLVKLLIPIYDKYYSENDIKELVSIYEMPSRQKEIEKTPIIMKESLETIVKFIFEKSGGKPAN
jgi:hypothetical protein